MKLYGIKDAARAIGMSQPWVKLRAIEHGIGQVTSNGRVFTERDLASLRRLILKPRKERGE